MDFFEEQDHARKRTRRLVFLFALAVLGIIVAIYGLGIFLYGYGVSEAGVGYATGDQGAAAATAVRFWNPSVMLFSVASTASVVGLGSLYKIAQLRAGGPAVALGLGARKVDPDTNKLEERRLVNIVEEMAIASGVPAPEVYVLDREPGINAFAAGNTTSDAVIGVTHGTLQLLRRDELQGVIAHELSHILNGDSRINLRAIGLLHGIFLLTLIGRFLIRGSAHSGEKESGGAAVVGLGLVTIGSIGVFFGRIIQSAVSRQRELLADASAVQFTRDPSGLAGALKKIGGISAGSRMETPTADEASHIFFANAIRRLPLFGALFRTHPPLEQRILKLEPQWDGTLSQVEHPRIADGWSSPPGPVGASARALADSPTEEAMSMALEHIGSPRPEQVAFAKALHAGLPDFWVHAAHQAPMAQAMVFGLLLSRDEVLRGTELLRLADLTDEQTADLTLRFHSESADRSSTEKIALVDMALPTLRSLSLREYERFRSIVDALMESDRRIDMFEYTLSRMIQRHLARYFEGEGPASLRYRSLKRLLPHAWVLISAVARAGARNEEKAAQAYRHGAQALHILGESSSIAAPDECTIDDLDRALSHYDAAAPVLKREIMFACAAAVMADDEVTDREAELIRAIGDALDCPVPPFVQSL